MRIWKTVCACAVVASLAACASSGNGHINTLNQDSATALLTGKLKDEVRREFGDAEVIEFASGQAIWVYQFTASPANLVKYVPVIGRMTATGTDIRELKILFGKDGRVKKHLLQDLHSQ